MFNNNKPVRFSLNSPQFNKSPTRLSPTYKPAIMTRTKCEEIMDAAVESKTVLAMNLLENYDIEPSNRLLMDKSQQNLLHIAAKTKNYMFAEFLVEKGVSQDKNIFGETPLDIAMKNSDSRMIQLLYEVNKVGTFKQSIKKLEDKCDDLRYNFERVSTINDQLKTENTNLKITNKRLRDSEEVNDREVKKLKTEKNALLEDNRCLQTTVNNLRNSMKK